MAEDGVAGLTPAAPKPAHVPQSLVYDFDMLLDPGFRRDPHDRYQQVLAEAPPIFWTPRGGGHWMLNRHDVIFDAARDWEAFSSELFPPDEVSAMLEKMLPGARMPQPIPIILDPPARPTWFIARHKR